MKPIVVAAEQTLPGAATILSILENSGAADIKNTIKKKRILKNVTVAYFSIIGPKRT